MGDDRWSSRAEVGRRGGRCSPDSLHLRERLRRAEEERDSAERAMQEAQEAALGYRKQLLEGCKISIHRYVEVARTCAHTLTRTTTLTRQRDFCSPLRRGGTRTHKYTCTVSECACACACVCACACACVRACVCVCVCVCATRFPFTVTSRFVAATALCPHWCCKLLHAVCW